MRLRAAAVLLAIAAGASTTAKAEATLGWSAPEGCIGSDAFAHAVEATMGEPITLARNESAASLRVRIVQNTSPPGFIARVEVGPVGAVRRREVDVDGNDCRALDDALVVVASLLLDDALRSPPEAPARRIRAPAVTARPLRSPLEVAVRVGARVRVDVLPGLSVGPGIEGELSFGALGLFVGAWLWPPTEALQDGAGGRFAAWTGELGACVRAHVIERVRVGGCARAAAGFVHASGVGLDPGFGSLDATAELSAHAVGSMEIASPLSVWIALGVAVPLVRDEYRYAESGISRLTFRPAAISPDLAIGLEIRAP